MTSTVFESKFPFSNCRIRYYYILISSAMLFSEDRNRLWVWLPVFSSMEQKIEIVQKLGHNMKSSWYSIFCHVLFCEFSVLFEASLNSLQKQGRIQRGANGAMPLPLAEIWGTKLAFVPLPSPPQKKFVKRRFMLCIHINVCQFNVNFVC